MNATTRHLSGAVQERCTDYLWIIIFLTERLNHNNDNVSLRQDRKDVLPRGANYAWIIMITIRRRMIMIIIMDNNVHVPFLQDREDALLQGTDNS